MGRELSNDDDDRSAMLEQQKEERLVAAYREKALNWNQSMRRSLLKTVCFLQSLTLVAALTRVVTIETAVSFAMSVLVTALLIVLDIELFPDRDTLSGQRRVESTWWAVTLIVLAVCVVTLFITGAGRAAAGIVAGFLVTIVLGQFSNLMSSQATRGY